MHELGEITVRAGIIEGVGGGIRAVAKLVGYE